LIILFGRNETVV